MNNFIQSQMGCCINPSNLVVHGEYLRNDPIAAGSPQAPLPLFEQAMHPVIRSSSPMEIQKPEKSQLSPPQLENLQNQARSILQNFKIAKLMEMKMGSLAHTSEQIRQVVDTILWGVQQIEKRESAEEKQIFAQIFKNAPEMHKAGKLFYHHVEQIFKNQMKEKKVKTESLSRIYHNIANFKKQQEIRIERQNQFEIKVKTSNGYNELAPKEIEEAVKLEAIGAKIEQLGVKMKMKYASIEKQSDNFISLLAECLPKYEKEIHGLKYDLNNEEVMKVAAISRDACSYHDNGVVLLLIYLVRACKTLETSKISVETIEQKMKQAISSISKRYPPGEGLKKEQENLKTALQTLKYEDKFFHLPSKLTSKDNKQDQLEKIIMHYANIAKKNRDDFEELIRQACFNLAIQTKIGLKLNPDKPQAKAIIRIKEKMLFSKSQVIQKQVKDNIEQTLKSQDDFYKSKIDQLLQEKDEILFKISDMVRGKCVFLQINEIMLTVEQIKAFLYKNNILNKAHCF